MSTDHGRWPLLRFPGVIGVALAVSLLLLLPSLWSGFLLDDYFFVMYLESDVLPYQPEPWSMFAFIPQDPALTQQHIREGFFPWWTHPEFKIMFFRPLSSLLVWFDFSVFGRNAFWHHLHSLLWWSGVLTVWGMLLWRVLPGRLGALALLLIAVDEAHITPAGWIASRNALVAALPVLLGLWAHLRWREDNWQWGLPLSLLGYAAGLAGAEAAVAVLAYVAAYELFAGPGRPIHRLIGLAPAVAVGCVYLAFYQWGDYGTHGSGFYSSPFSEPAQFASRGAVHWVVLLGDEFFGITADFWNRFPQSRELQFALAAAAAALFACLFAASYRALDGTKRRSVRWLVAGALLSMIPTLAVIPSNRMLLAPFLGGSVAVAVVLCHGWDCLRRVDLSRWRRSAWAAAAGLLFVVHFLYAPLLSLAMVNMLTDFARTGKEIALTMELDEQTAGQKDVVVLAAPSMAVAHYVPIIRFAEGKPWMGSWRLLTLSRFDHRVTRTGPRTVELEVLNGSMFANEVERLYRTPNAPFKPGDVITAGPLKVEILEMGASGPRRVAFHFATPLEAPRWHFVAWKEGRLRQIAIPPLGKSLVLRAPAVPPGGL